MNILSTFILFVFVPYSNGLPASVFRRSALPSCPQNSMVLNEFNAASPCAIFCLEDVDCVADGLACCTTGQCGSRCVASSILERSNQFQEERGTTEDGVIGNDVIEGDFDVSKPKDGKIGQELDILKEKLSEIKTKEEQKDNNEELLEEQEESKESLEVKEEDEKDAEEEVQDVGEEDEGGEEENFKTQGPLVGTEETDVEDDGTLEGGGEEENKGENGEEEGLMEEDGYKDDDDGEGEDAEEMEEEDDEFDDYSKDEEGEEDLEMLLMELLYDLKSKQNSKHSPWKEETHTSRSLLQRKNDFMENAMPPSNALEAVPLKEEPRALDDQLGGYFFDRPFKKEELQNQEVAGRRSSMEKRDEGFVDEETKVNAAINRSIMRR